MNCASAPAPSQATTPQGKYEYKLILKLELPNVELKILFPNKIYWQNQDQNQNQTITPKSKFKPKPKPFFEPRNQN